MGDGVPGDKLVRMIPGQYELCAQALEDTNKERAAQGLGGLSLSRPFDQDGRTEVLAAYDAEVFATLMGADSPSYRRFIGHLANRLHRSYIARHN